METKGFLSKFDFFSNLSEDKCEEIERHSDILEFKAGEIIFHINEPAEKLYGVIDGKIELHLTFMDGNKFEESVECEESFLKRLKILHKFPYKILYSIEKNYI